MGLTGAASIDSLEVNCAPWIPICFCCDRHPALPLDWGVHRSPLQHPKPDVSVEAVENCLLPVEGYNARGMHSSGPCCRVNMEFKGRTALQEREWLVFTDIECGGSISVHQILPELREIFLQGRAWHQGRGRWWQLTLGT